MARYIKVCKTSEIADGTAKCVEVGDETIAVFNSGGEFYAINDLCTHEDAPLSEGYVEGVEVECPWHAARFNLKTGKAMCAPAYEDVVTYPVRVTDDEIEVEVGDDA